MVIGSHGNGNPIFQVLDKNNKFLVDVTDILSGFNAGVFHAGVVSGKTNDNTGLASPTTTDLQIFALFYDDTQAGGSLQFNLLGVLTNTKTDTTPNAKTKTYTQTESHKMPTAAGDGNYQNSPLIITGGFTASGSIKLTLP